MLRVTQLHLAAGTERDDRLGTRVDGLLETMAAENRARPAISPMSVSTEPQHRPSSRLCSISTKSTPGIALSMSRGGS